MEQETPLTRENGLKAAEAVFSQLQGALPKDITLLVYILSADPIRLGDPATNAMAEFFSGKGITVRGILFDPRAFEAWRGARPDGQALRQEWAEREWNRIPDFETFGADVKHKQKWTAKGWRNFRDFGN